MASKVFFCEVCLLHFNGFQTYQDHVNSNSHAKAVVDNKRASSKNSEDDDFCISTDGMYFCKICNTSVTGIIPWEQHKAGSQHLKKIKNKELLSSLEKTKKIHEQLLQNSPSKYSSTTDVGNKSVSINVSVSSNSPNTKSDSDIDSLCKKLEMVKCTSDNDTSSVQCTVNTSPAHAYYGDHAMFPFKCEACCKKFTGIESYQQHTESIQHKKKVELASCSMPKSYYCDICAILLSGPIPYRQHMESVKHAKKAMMHNSGSQPFSPNSSIFSTSTPNKLDEGKEWQQLLASKPINVSVEIKNNASESSDIKVVEADEAFTISEESRENSVDRRQSNTKMFYKNHKSDYDKSGSDEDGESKFDDAQSMFEN